jgi:hypothetical protein
MDKIIDEEKLAKIVFIYNALESGWTITKRDDNYIFKKKHGEKKEVFEEAYLKSFIKSNSNIQNFLSK